MDKKARGFLYTLMFHYALTLIYFCSEGRGHAFGVWVVYIVVAISVLCAFLSWAVAMDAPGVMRSWLFNIIFAYGPWVFLAALTMLCFPWLIKYLAGIAKLPENNIFNSLFYPSAFIVALFTVYGVVKYRALKQYMKKYSVPMEEARVMLRKDFVEAWGSKTRKGELKRQRRKQLKEQLPPSDAPLVDESKLKDGML